MLQSQVNYWTLQENKRHNVQQELLGFDTLRETQRHNVVQESLGFETLAETRRHNVTTEQLGFDTLYETKRHNVQNEQLGYLNYAETARHNKATEGLGFANLDLGYAQLGETSRHNEAEEWIGQQNVNVKANEYELSKDKFAWQKDVDTTKLAQTWKSLRQKDTELAYQSADLDRKILMDEHTIRQDSARFTLDTLKFVSDLGFNTFNALKTNNRRKK